MNTLLIIITLVVGFYYFGENKCPKIFNNNKEMLLIVLIGLALYFFTDSTLEGFECSNEELLCHDIEDWAINTTSQRHWSIHTTEDTNSFLNRLCNNMGPFSRANINNNTYRLLTPEDDQAMQAYFIGGGGPISFKEGTFRLSSTNDAEISGCEFCQKREVIEATYPENPIPCIDHLTNCNSYLNSRYTCQDFAPGAPMAGICNYTCNFC